MLVGKLRRPALVNLHVVQSPVELRDLTPGALPDLFYGEELVVFGRYHGTGTGQVIIEGERNGHRERFTAEASFPSTSAANEFIPKLWASRRIGDLTRQIRLEGASEGRIRDVRELGLRYGILTEYTSYLVQEPTLAIRHERGRPDAMQVLPSAASAMAAPIGATAQTGKAAFDRAAESGHLSQANSLAEADAAVERKFTAISRASRELRRAGGRMFALKDGVWTDVRQEDSLRVVTVVPFSAAYFAVLRALPEVTASLQTDGPVLIAGKQASLKVAAGGRDTLSAAEVQAFVRAFRGTA
jgi:Ca-activated chloride channel family protein